MLVGAPGDPITSNHAGAAYVYRFDAQAGAWSYAAKLRPSIVTEGDHFGHSVGLSGNNAIVGSLGGYAYLFRYDSALDLWVEEQMLQPAGSAGSAFGISVAIHGSLAIAGAPYHSHPTGLGIGAVYVFQRSLLCTTGRWCEQLLLLPDYQTYPGYGQQWGALVGLSGDTAIVGAPLAGSHGAFLILDDVPGCP